MTSDQKQAEQPEQAAQGDAEVKQHDAGHSDMEHQGAEPGAAEVAPSELPGEFLAARRQQLNLSIEDVSMRVRLAPRQVAALEANDFAALPGKAIVRGFVRSYAKLLGLDPEPLVAMLVIEPNPSIEPVGMRRPLPSSGFSNRRYASSVTHRRGAQRLAGFAAVLLVFVGALAFIAYRKEWFRMPATDAASAPVSGSAEMSVGKVDDAGTQSPSSPVAAAPASAPAAATTTPATAATTATTATTATAAASAPAAASVAQPGSAQASSLALRAREDSWVEVIAVNGERKLLSKLMKAGTGELLEVSEPVVLVVGNAAGVEADLRGRPLNLAAAAHENVVKLSLK